MRWLIDGLLIKRGRLGGTGPGIDWVPLSELGDTYTVYHIETEEHDIILAEGATCRDLLSTTSGGSPSTITRSNVALYGEERLMQPRRPYPPHLDPALLPPALKARLAGAVAA